MIYMVRAYRKQELGRCHYIFQGKVQGSRSTEDLDLQWMNQNHMGTEWRKKTIFQRPEHWYRVPVLKTSDPDQRQVCTSGCVTQALTYMGLADKTVKFKFASNRIVERPFTQVLQLMQSVKGFTHYKWKSPATTFDPVKHVLFEQMYFMQIRAKSNRTGYTDNTHAICVFHKLIFDVNHVRPLQLTRENLDRCCLGNPEWVYDCTVRLSLFTPTKRVYNFITKHLSNHSF